MLGSLLFIVYINDLAILKLILPSLPMTPSYRPIITADNSNIFNKRICLAAVVHPYGPIYIILSYVNIERSRLEPIMLKSLPIIPSRTSQKFYPLLLIYSQIITYYSFIILLILLGR